ncbi:uncharacterized protein [Elaeis guineensis]|uniref:Uncharacterized protein LOC105052574 n=1 Tax=Elaeis guineensis var. tenera TaxID=51953 RepID=A0A6I9S1D2_ELAGV|nr:uncharacterized protein LOC105052574 [Elaeis guineensis]XP_010931727.1 uncharacterized protein LOC105052574 [Elaeis guineensis]XP_029122733.1 uncharacterized protein LOC105052574 [Elaeis guineensis]
MRAEKGGSSGFFNPFDWNRKSRKKLFSNGSASSRAIEGKKLESNMSTSLLRLIDEDEMIGVSSVKGSSDYNCTSSVTDEEGNTFRAPGVVARLMGLTSMPISGTSVPYSTPLHDSRSLQDNHSQRRSPGFYINDQFNHVIKRSEAYSRIPAELRSQKMPNSPIKRFQTEALPPRLAKSVPTTHHKLLSPIKNPGFFSVKNAAHIMEATTKVLGPEVQISVMGRFQSFVSLSNPIKVCNSQEIMAASPRTTRLPESSRRHVESASMRSLRGQPVNRSWDGSEHTTVYRSSPITAETNSAGAKGKGRSISSAVQAKVIVQKREGLGTSNRSASVQKDNNECKSNRPLKNQSNNPKNNQQKRAATNASSLLKQNNQKQNCLASKNKLPSKPSVSNQQGRKILSGDASSRKNKIVNKLSGSTRISFSKGDIITSDNMEEGLSSDGKNFPCKKKMIEQGSSSKKSEAPDGILVDRHEKHVQHTVVVDEQPRWTGDKTRNGADVVSFTFTSPMIKPLPGSQISTHVVEKEDKHNGPCSDTNCQNHASDSDCRHLSSLRSDVIVSDSLGFLLELRELTSEAESPSCKLIRGSITATGPVSQDSVSAIDTPSIAPTEHEGGPVVSSCKDELGGIFESSFSLASGQMFTMSHHMLEAERMECSSTRENQKLPDHQYQSPISILEVPFSNESCSSSESWESPSGKMHDSSVQSQHIVDLSCFNETSSVEAEMELSDSASSTEITRGAHPPEISRTGHTDVCNQELEYVREILSNMKCLFKNLDPCQMDHDGGVLDPLLFDKLETSGSLIALEGEERDSRMRRKMLFDCVNECMDLKCSHYFHAGYQMWTKGLAVVMKDWTEELYKEISGWRSMGDWMVDELVDRDMSSRLGRWVNFDTEAYETGGEIEMAIFNSLVDEVVADFMIEVPP